MRKKILLIGIVLLIVLTSLATAIPVFPGAEGFGTHTLGGRGGEICVVDNLSPSGTGSLKYCAEKSGARHVIFEVSGTIEPADAFIYITKPYISIWGETAPSPGITVKGFIAVATHDVLIRHLRVRAGDDNPYTPSVNRVVATVRWTSSGGQQPVKNVVFDHLTSTWGLDQVMTLGGEIGSENQTVSNSILAECLRNSLHPDGIHSMGLITSHSNNIAIIKNLIMSNKHRNPSLHSAEDDEYTYFMYANNLVYNTESYGGFITADRGDGEKKHSISAIGNVVIEGPSTRNARHALFIMADTMPGSKVYAEDNECENYNPTPEVYCIRDDTPAGTITYLSSPEIMIPVDIWSSSDVEQNIIKNVGARPADRDPVDTRLINELINKQGKIIDCVDSDPIYLHTGTIKSANSNTATLADSAWNHYDSYNGKFIEITSGKGAGQYKEIIGYTGDTHIATVDSTWNTIPDSTSQYRIIIDCTDNAGGWPVLAKNTRTLTVPSNPNGDDDNDGYTNFEEWVFTFAAQVEGGSPPPPVCTSHDYSSCDSGDVYWYDSCNAREGIRYECGIQECINGACVATPPQTKTYTALKTIANPIINADCSEYNDANSIQIIPTQGGNTGNYKLLWNNNAIFICGQVSDSELNADYTQENSEVYRDDSIEVVFDTQYDSVGSIDSDDYKFYVNILNTQKSSLSNQWNSDVSYSGTINNNGDSDSSYSIEFSVPWNVWGITPPQAGISWGFDLRMNDKDSLENLDIDWVNSDGGTFNNPEGWGEMVFSAQETAPIEGDVNGDGKVNIYDLIEVATNFGLTSGFDERADTDSNNVIDIFDVVFVASRFT